MLSHEEIAVMAHRYLYYVLCEPIISDAAYDDMEKIALNKALHSSPVLQVGSSLASSYTPEMISYAMKIKDEKC